MDAEYLQGFYLGDLLVEPLKGRVSGKNGEHHLPPKAAEVLLCLARHAGEIVPHEKLLECAWGEGNGTPEALSHVVSEIRHALGDHPTNPRFIQTLPRLGYRLIADPAPTESPLPERPAPSGEPRWWHTLLRHGVIQAAAAYLVVGWLLIQVADTTFEKIGLPAWSEQLVTFVVIGGFPLVIFVAWCFDFVDGRMHRDRGQQSGNFLQGLERNYLAIVIAYGIAGIGAGVYHTTVGFPTSETTPTPSVDNESELIPVTENSVAVLRLATFDDDPTTRAFSDGLSEDILDGLARIPGLLVSARGDSWSLPPHASSDNVRRRLRVAHYIEGSVRFLEEKLRVVVQFIDSETGFHLFSRDFEIDIAATGDMQREITRLVVANLRLAVDTDALDAISVSTASSSRDAYVQYMLGREVMNRPTSLANIEEAIGYFNESLSIDADYPAAHAGLCNAHVSLYELQKDTASIDLAERACAAAQDVAPQLPVVLDGVGRLYRQTGKPDEAERAYLAALAINGRDATALSGLALIRRGQQRYEEAEALMRQAVELQPGNWNALNSLGNLYFRMGQYANAAKEYRKVVFLNPENHIVLGNLASTSLMSGDFAGARDAFLRSIDIEENATYVTNLGITYYYLGDLDEAIRTLRRAVDLVPNDESTLVALADALQAGGREMAAREAYERARDLAEEHMGVAGDNPDYLTALAWTTAMTGDIERAALLAQRAVDIDPAYPYSHYYKALVALRAGDADTALESCELALENGYPGAMLAAEPMLKELRDHSRFAELLAEYNVGGQQQ